MSSTCLVARAIPIPRSLPNVLEDEEDRALKASDAAESLANTLSDLQISKSSSAPSHKAKTSSSGKKSEPTSPAEMFAMQSLRSSCLAGKTNTTTKVTRNCHSLMSDLLAFNEEVKEKDAEKTVKEEESKKDAQKKATEKDDEKVEPKKADDKMVEKAQEDLLSRGPDRVSSRSTNNFHPYHVSTGQPTLDYAIVAPQSTVVDASAYNSYGTYAYDCGVPSNFYYSSDCRDNLSNSSTPDTINSDLGYSSATSPPQMKYGTHYGRHGALDDYVELCSGMKTSAIGRLAQKFDSTELPDALSDFILKYSRRYTPSIDSSRKTSISTAEHSPAVVDSLCNSPLSAGSAPRNSPAAPHGGFSDTTSPPGSAKIQHAAQFAGITGVQPPKQAVKRPAKERLRVLINNEDMDEAWAWTCKLLGLAKESFECLTYQDNGGDTLLHIVVCQPDMDLAKIYALVEQMLKMESELSQKPFDVRNRFHETPLFLAVEKRHNEVVDYLLEAGASPNTQNSRTEREAPLHYAAARGMVDIVQTLCSNPNTNLNMLNGMGLTPLLCAVKNHGVLEEESQSLIDNKATIQLLLKNGADPTITDATNGKSVIAYAVERMNAEIIEIFQSNLIEEAMVALVNKPDLSNETPMAALQSIANADPEVTSKIGLTLITCGAASH